LHSHPFEPIIDKSSKILILGSFPSLKSFENSFYYAHPKNQFWNILSEIFTFRLNNIDEKQELLRLKRIALWDVVASCSRSNSLDSNLKNITPNKIDDLLKQYHNIDAIGFTGQKSAQIFKRHFSHLRIHQEVLPSPSPAYCKISLQEKIEIYREFFTRNLSGGV